MFDSVRSGWSTHKKLMFLKAAAAVPAVEDTATGNPVTFLTDLAKPLRELKVNFLPVQQGSGDPSPENKRPIIGWHELNAWHGGKNLFDESAVKYSGYILSAIGEMSTNANYNVSDYIFMKAGTYSVSFDNYNAPSVNVVFRVCCYSGKNTSTFTETAYEGSPLEMDKRIEATFTITSDCFVLVSWRKTMNNAIISVGSTASEYEPYIAPIFYPVVFGKNLFNKDAEPYQTGKYINNESPIGGSLKYTDNANYNVFAIQIKKNTTYTFGLIKATQPCFALVDANNKVTFVDTNRGGENGTYRTVTTGENDVYLLLSVSVNGTYKCDDILQLELGPEHTSYEPYGNTVYGGYYNLVTGVLMDGWKVVDMGSLEWTYRSGDDNFTAPTPSDAFDMISSADIINNFSCEVYEGVFSFVGDNVITMNNRSTGLTKLIRVRDQSFNTDAEAFTAFVTGKKLAYKLATPQEIQLTSQQINAIKDQTNTIWSDANGNVEVTFIKKG